jgi:hypothetical protein
LGKPTTRNSDKHESDLYYDELKLTLRFDKKTKILKTFWIDSISRVRINKLEFMKSDSLNVIEALGFPSEKENKSNGYLYNYSDKQLYIFFNKQGLLKFINVEKKDCL